MSLFSALNEPRLRLAEVLARDGIKLCSDPAHARRDALATRRCVLCPSQKKCDAWLASGRREGLGAFCPNAGYILGRAA